MLAGNYRSSLSISIQPPRQEAGAGAKNQPTTDDLPSSTFRALRAVSSAPYTGTRSGVDFRVKIHQRLGGREGRGE